MAALLACPPLAAHAATPRPARSPAPSAEPANRADYLAARLRRDPVYVTDHAPRALPTDAAAQIKASVARLRVPAYVVVTPTSGLGDEDRSPDELISLLRDRLGRNGVYVVVGPGGGFGAARQFGGSLPVDDAWSAADLEMPYDAGAPAVIERFVEIALSGRARERRDDPRPRPAPADAAAGDEYDRATRRADLQEMAALGAGAALSGLTTLWLLARRRLRPAARARRRPATRTAPGAQTVRTVRTQPVRTRRKRRKKRQGRR